MAMPSIPRLQAASILGRARTDLSALLLMALVIALTAMLASAVPPVAERAADRAVADAVADAGPTATLTATAPVREQEPTARDPRAAAGLRQDGAVAELDLTRRLAAVLHPPVSSVTSSDLQVLGDGPGRYLRMAYVSGPHGAPAVTWVAGRRPAGTVTGSTVPSTAPSPWPIQVGLSQVAATALGAHVGDRLSTQDSTSRSIEVRVTGIFVAKDAGDELWQADTHLLQPTGVSPATTRLTVAALVSDESLPDLPLAVPTDDLTRRVTFTPRAQQVRWRQTATLARAVVRLKATPKRYADGGTSRSWDTQLDSVLRRAHDEAAAARAQAAVLVLGLLVAAGLVLALTAQLLVRRRAGALVVARERGAGLVATAAELLVESVLLSAVATAVGLAVSQVLTGSPSWAWALPVAAVGVLAAPILGVWAAGRATSGRRVPANRAARRRQVLARRLRRVVAETAVVMATVAALVALRQRGVVSASPEEGIRGGTDLLAVSAPTMVIVLGVLAVVRMVPWLARTTLTRLRSSVRAVPFLSAAGGGADAARPLPFLVIALTVAQLTLGVAMAATLHQGQSAGAWRSVGADARLQAAPSPALTTLARTAADAPGVRAALAARVVDGVPASSGDAAAVVRLVVVDAAAFARLLAATPYPAPQLRRLAGPEGTRLPALVGGGLSSEDRDLTITWEDAEVPLVVSGPSPAISTGSGPVVVVDAAEFAAAGHQAPPDTIWAAGPGAARALEGVRVRAGSLAPVVDRRDVLARQRAAPLVGGLRDLVVVSGGLLVLLGVLGVLLGAALGAPTRLASLSRLRTMGLFRREARLVLAGHLVPSVLLAAVTGCALGAACAAWTLPLLDLDLLTGQTQDLQIVVPWWTTLFVLVMLAAVGVVTLDESSRRRSVTGALPQIGPG